MYKTKADYLRERFPEKDCFSAITTKELDCMTVGTPVMVDMKPITSVSAPHANIHSYSSSIQIRRGNAEPTRIAPMADPRESRGAEIGNMAEINREPSPAQIRHLQPRHLQPPDSSHKPKGKPSPANTKKVSAKDLYEMGIVEANKILQSSVKINTIFVFSLYKDYRDFYVQGMHSHHVYFDGKKPLIFDEGRRFELERLADVHKKDELNNFSEMIRDSLRKNRYINYSFEGVATSNKKYMLEDINTIFNDLQRAFPKNFSFFMSVLNNGTLRSLVDTVSISFYRMQDVIAIFDSKETSGMGVEIFLTNSNHRPIFMDEPEATATYRFLFSKSRENILTIDGELINRQNNRTTSDALSVAVSVISKNIPVDDKLKKVKDKTISVG